MDEIVEIVVEVGGEILMAGADALMSTKVKDKEKKNEN